MTLDKIIKNLNLDKLRIMIKDNTGKEIPFLHHEYIKRSLKDLKDIIKQPGDNVNISHAYTGHLLRLYRLDRMVDDKGKKLYDMHKYYDQLVKDILPYVYIYYKKLKKIF